ncbi:hypothetical protein A4S05_34435 [Nostoc sp. KVJ20]|nr:hypothetical protein A4S05_34435 [Nostoc sp. KVJ20]
MSIQYGSPKARDAINRRLYKGLILVKTATYRVFAIGCVSSKNLIRTGLYVYLLTQNTKMKLSRVVAKLLMGEVLRADS